MLGQRLPMHAPRQDEASSAEAPVTHANMPSVCSSAAIGSGNTGSGVAALGCFLWTIYDHYPFNNMAFQQSFDLFGFESITQATTNALASTEKASLTASIASAYMTNNFAASTSAALTWNTPMSSTFVSGRRRLQSPRELQSSVDCARRLGRRPLRDDAPAPRGYAHRHGVARPVLHLGVRVLRPRLLMHVAHGAPGQHRPQRDLHLRRVGSVHRADLPGERGDANYPYCCTGSCSAGRQLTHGSQNSMCHPASSTLTRCDGSSLRIDAAAVGDSIRTPSGCEPITGLFHADAEAFGTYHKFTTKGGASVAISDDHWLFVNGAEADPATVKPGDLLTTASGEQEAVVRVETTTERARSTSSSPRAPTTSTASPRRPTSRTCRSASGRFSPTATPRSRVPLNASGMRVGHSMTWRKAW